MYKSDELHIAADKSQLILQNTSTVKISITQFALKWSQKLMLLLKKYR